MKFVDEYRDEVTAHKLKDALHGLVTRPWTIMEICGGQTHAIMRFGVDQLLPKEISLLHGPGCPVCVTSEEVINHAIALANRPDIILCSFGDMLRVPGSDGSLISARATGADVRVVYSPLDALEIARANKKKEVVFLAVGFETTAPTTAAAVFAVYRERISNFSMLTAHVRVPPAIEKLLSAPDHGIDGFLAAGHVCTVMGLAEYEPLARQHQIPIVATGFEPVDILHGIYLCVQQLESGVARVENQYARAIQPEGNLPAQALMAEVFETVPQNWRGLGQIPESGLSLASKFRDFDACYRFSDVAIEPLSEKETSCMSGLVLQGKIRPDRCPAFGNTCTPEHPKGATMVSSEGACAAYYRYRREAVTV